MILPALPAAIAAAFLLAMPTAIADERVPTLDPRRESGGNAREFKNRVFAPSRTPSALPEEHAPTQRQRSVAARAEAVLRENQGALSVLVVENGRVLYEGYRAPAARDTPQHSQSMSKSLTAYTVGHMLCEGRIGSLDDPAQKYARQLAGTVYGEASLRHLLTMTSGAALSSSSGNSYDRQFDDVRAGKVSALSVMLRYGARDIPAGKEFRYLANDTMALAYVADAAGGFLDGFERHVWSRIGAEGPGYWLLDNEGTAIANSGISATTRDWARLAMFSASQLASDDPCVRDFMKAATSAQVANTLRRTGRAFPAYGYQTWIRDRTYWWVGYGGQRVGIDPRTGRILVVTSWREDYMDRVYRFFDDWNAGR